MLMLKLSIVVLVRTARVNLLITKESQSIKVDNKEDTLEEERLNGEVYIIININIILLSFPFSLNCIGIL